MLIASEVNLHRERVALTDPIPVWISHPLPRRREVNPNGWGQDSFESVGSALWGAVPHIAVRSQRAVRSAGHPKSFYHPYQVLHDCQPLARLSDFMVASSGETQAQAGRRGIGSWGDTS